jgi:hypothetical protein
MRIVKHFPAQWPTAFTWIWMYLNIKVSASRAFAEILCGCSVYPYTVTTRVSAALRQSILCISAEATGWTAGVRFPAETRDFSLLHSDQTGCVTPPASYPMSTGGSLKRPRRETDHSPPACAEVKNGGAMRFFWQREYFLPPPNTPPVMDQSQSGVGRGRRFNLFVLPFA